MFYKRAGILISAGPWIEGVPPANMPSEDKDMIYAVIEIAGEEPVAVFETREEAYEFHMHMDNFFEFFVMEFETREEMRDWFIGPY